MALPGLFNDARRQGNRYPDERIRCIMNNLVTCNHVCSILSLQIQSLLYNIGADLASTVPTKKRLSSCNSLDSLCFYGDTFQMEERYFLVNAAGIARRPAIRP